jgi:hypothetical protein
MNALPPAFKGNKQALPSKPCAACGRTMTWRKRWALNWTEVKFCSDACRKSRAKALATPDDGKAGVSSTATR